MEYIETVNKYRFFEHQDPLELTKFPNTSIFIYYDTPYGAHNLMEYKAPTSITEKDVILQENEYAFVMIEYVAHINNQNLLKAIAHKSIVIYHKGELVSKSELVKESTVLMKDKTKEESLKRLDVINHILNVMIGAGNSEVCVITEDSVIHPIIMVSRFADMVEHKPITWS